MGSATCSARRPLIATNNSMEIVKGTAYSITSGFMIYDNEADFDSGTASSSRSGEAQEIIFAVSEDLEESDETENSSETLDAENTGSETVTPVDDTESIDATEEE